VEIRLSKVKGKALRDVGYSTPEREILQSGKFIGFNGLIFNGCCPAMLSCQFSGGE